MSTIRQHAVAPASTPAGRYVVEGLIARGGTAEVLRGCDTRLDRRVAIKRLRAEFATDPTSRTRFRRETAAAAGLSHPAIVSVYDTGETDDPETGLRLPYMVMELVDGPSLKQVVEAEGRLDALRALRITASVLDALTCSHSAGIVHRDVKPGNVMLTQAGQVKVADFGIARTVDGAHTVTQTGLVMGTPLYMSPEQVRGSSVDARSDLYSAGCLLYELLTGRPPFSGDSAMAIAYHHVAEPPSPPSIVEPTLPRGVDEIIRTALAKDPAERYQTAGQMKTDIYKVLRPSPLGASGSDADRDGLEPADRSSIRLTRAALPLLAGLIVAALTLTGAVGLMAGRDPGPVPAATAFSSAVGEVPRVGNSAIPQGLIDRRHIGTVTDSWQPGRPRSGTVQKPARGKHAESESTGKGKAGTNKAGNNKTGEGQANKGAAHWDAAPKDKTHKDKTHKDTAGKDRSGQNRTGTEKANAHKKGPAS